MGKRGSGKTYSCGDLAEEFLENRMHLAIIDPTDAWWGLRSSSSGKSAGYPIIVMGGDHADIPLEPTAGKVVAEMIVHDRLDVILSLDNFKSNGEQVRFVQEFLDVLYRINKKPLHLIIDEADEFAPQRPTPNKLRCLGSVDRIARRARIKGIGLSLLTQRPAVLNKDVFSQVEVLIAHQVTGVQDRKAISAWIEVNADSKVGIMDQIPSLLPGDCFFWSPSWLRILKKTRMREKRTFDSSATPKVGTRIRAPKKRASVDLGAIQEKIKATIERSQAEDPRLLREKIENLKQDLAGQKFKIGGKDQQIERLEAALKIAQRAPKQSNFKFKFVKLPYLTPMELAKLDRYVKKILAAEATIRSLPELGSTLSEVFGKAGQRQDRAIEKFHSIADPADKAVHDHLEPKFEEMIHGTPSELDITGKAAPKPTRQEEPPKASGVRQSPEETAKIFKKLGLEKFPGMGENKILCVLRRFRDGLVRKDVGFFTVSIYSGGTFGTYFSRLKNVGLIQEDGEHYQITENGLEYLAYFPEKNPDLPLKSRDILEAWAKNLKGGGMPKILRAMYEDATSLSGNMGRIWTREAIGEAINNKFTGGTFGTYLSRLRKYGLIEQDSKGYRINKNFFII